MMVMIVQLLQLMNFVVAACACIILKMHRLCTLKLKPQITFGCLLLLKEKPKRPPLPKCVFLEFRKNCASKSPRTETRFACAGHGLPAPARFKSQVISHRARVVLLKSSIRSGEFRQIEVAKLPFVLNLSTVLCLQFQ